MENPNSPTESRHGLDVNHDHQLDLLAGLRAFLARDITTEAQGLPPLKSDTLPPAPIGPRK